MFPWNKQYPFNQQKMPDFFKSMNPNQVENYVQEVMGQVFGQDQSGGFPYQFSKNREEKQAPPSENWYEATDRIYFKIKIPAKIAGDVKIQHNSHQLTLENFPEKGERKTFQIPFLVRRKGTKATYQDEELELSFIKNEDLNVTEIHIPEGDIRS
ncbi:MULTISPECIES: hypothetical protein [Bacillaceae]|uniref:Spore gernimation protein GerT n=1 Tax=Metabacillus sediminis TaxID=3117746 RepID=A0ABZ2NC14_9BACI|nr:hypothetical protein [Bacillus sp. SJS]KZZ84290.1 hypothetical protein AS29_012090 [Bacillus sp. SJS]